MLLFIEDGIRGGLTQVIKKYSTANNKYMQKNDKNKKNNHIFNILMLIAYMLGQCVINFQLKILNGLKI